METIYGSPLFKGLSSGEVDRLLDGKFTLHEYAPEEVVALRGDKPTGMLIVVSGAVRGEMTNQQGDRIVIEEIPAPRAIAPAFLYASDNTLPVDVIAVSRCTIISISIPFFTSLLQQNVLVLTNYLRIMSDRGRFLSDRVRLLRFGTIKSKLAAYLLELSQKEKSTELVLKHTHQELADMFGVTRPALSRAISQMEAQGLLTARKNHITLMDRRGLQVLLL